jgi:hypothetical protein
VSLVEQRSETGAGGGRTCCCVRHQSCDWLPIPCGEACVGKSNLARSLSRFLGVLCVCGEDVSDGFDDIRSDLVHCITDDQPLLCFVFVDLAKDLFECGHLERG